MQNREVAAASVPWPAAVTIVAASLLGVALGALNVGRRSLWFDEAASVAYARLDWNALGAALHLSDAYFGAYYGLLHLWLALGDSEGTIRALSVACAGAAVIAIAALAWRLGGTQSALIAAILAATNPFAIQLSHEARPYTMLILMTTLTGLAFIEAARRPSPLRWILFTLCAIVACYIHLFAAFALFAFVVWAALLHRELFARGLGIALLVIGASVMPLVITVRGYGAFNGWLGAPGKSAIFRTLAAFAGSAATLVLAVAVAASAFMRTDARNDRQTREVFAFALIWLVVPPLAAFLLSLIRPFYEDRYLSEAWPAFVIIVALALGRLPKFVAATVTMIFIVLAIGPLMGVYGNVVEDWRGAAALVLREAAPSDVLAIYPQNGTIAYDYYRRRADVRGPTRIFPQSDPFPFDAALGANDGPNRGTLPSRIDIPHNLWIILDPLTDDPEASPGSARFLASVPKGYVLVKRTRFVRLTVLQYRPRASQG